jgi:LysM repeat protein
MTSVGILKPLIPRSFGRFITAWAVCILAWWGSFAQSSDHFAYIDRYKNLAIQEMERAGVPASIKIAQALVETNAGKSELARKANNHFGIKCGGDWSGKKFYRKDDDYNDRGDLVESCFRAYHNVEDSYIAHSEFLRANESRYGFLFRLNPRDYRRWATGLKQAGYATSANYHEMLIKTIETYELYKFDLLSSTDILAGTTAPGVLLRILVNNDVKMVLARAGDTPASIAEKTQTDLRQIMKYNEKMDNPNRILKENERVYLQPKRNGYRDRKKFHYVKYGETLYDISQLYGIKLTKLQSRNRVPGDAELAVGERLKMRGCKVKPTETPRLSTELPPPTPPPPPSEVPPVKNGDKPKPDKPTPQPQPAPADPEEFTPEFPVRPPSPPTQPTTTRPTTTPTPPTPPVTQPTKPVDTTPVTPPATADGLHTVVKGDTLYNISKRYGLTVDALMKLNNLTSTNIQLGQKLRVK